MTDIIKTGEIFGTMDRLYERSNYYAAHSIADNTRKAYESDWKQFVLWCAAHETCALPAPPDTVAAYFSDLADRETKIATITRRFTSISVIHAAAGFDSPCKSSAVARVLKGIRKTVGKPSEKARAISWAELRRMVDHCDSSMSGRRDRALLLLGWTSALRRSELVALNTDDLNFCDEGLVLTIRSSKTDQEGKGVMIAIPMTYDDSKRSDRAYCTVKAVKDWLERREKKDESSCSEQPLFVNLGPKGNRNWFAGEKGRLNDRMVALIVKRYAGFIGLPTASISAHSLRRGFATECGVHAIPERIIARHTRHRSFEVLRGYIEDGSIWRENPLYFIFGTAPRHHIMSSNAAV